MSVGYPSDKTAIDSRAGSLAVQARDLLMVQIPNFNAFLNTLTDQYLTQQLTPEVYTEQEVADLKSLFSQLAALGQVAQGAATAATATNFLQFIEPIVGPN